MNNAFALDARKSAEEAFSSGLNCAESVLLSLAAAQGISSDLLPRIATALGGGMARSCGQCGALSGGMLGIGLALGRDEADESVDTAYAATRELIRQFEAAFRSRNCRDLLDGCDLGTPEGQAIFKERQLRTRCLNFTGTAAEVAARLISERSP